MIGTRKTCQNSLKSEIGVELVFVCNLGYISLYFSRYILHNLKPICTGAYSNVVNWGEGSEKPKPFNYQEYFLCHP